MWKSSFWLSFVGSLCCVRKRDNVVVATNCLCAHLRVILVFNKHQNDPLVSPLTITTEATTSIDHPRDITVHGHNFWTNDLGFDKSKYFCSAIAHLSRIFTPGPFRLLIDWTFYLVTPFHDDVIKWKYFPRYWPFVRGIYRSPVNSPHKGQWRGALMFLWSAPE